MNPHLKQRIDEKLELLSEQRIAEVLDFVEFHAVRKRVDEVAERTAYLAGVEHSLNVWSSKADERPYRELKAL